MDQLDVQALPSSGDDVKVPDPVYLGVRGRQYMNLTGLTRREILDFVNAGPCKVYELTHYIRRGSDGEEVHPRSRLIEEITS